MRGLYRAQFQTVEWEHVGVLVFHHDGTLSGGNHELAIKGRYMYVDEQIVLTLHAETHSAADRSKAWGFRVVVTGNSFADDLVLDEIPRGMSKSPISLTLRCLA